MRYHLFLNERARSLTKYTAFKNPSVVRTAGVITFAALTCLGAFIRIPLPFTPVPITLQTFFVLLSGALLGKKYGSYSQILYVTIGSFGLPVFSGGGGGLLYLLGPTGGYLVGFAAASFVTGFLLEKKRSFLFVLFSMFAATMLIYLGGVIWLNIISRSWRQSFFLGISPFIIGDCLKALLAALICYEKK